MSKLTAALTVGCAASLLALAGCSKSSDQAATPTSGPGSADPDPVPRAPGAASAPEPGVVDEALLAELPSLRRVEQALLGAPVNAGITRADRLEHARAWIAEHKADLTPREAEFQAQLLAMFEELFDAEEMSLAKATALSESQLLGLWGMDADGDGTLTPEEAMEGMGKMMQMDMATNDYFKDRFDTDGDGTVSDEEAQAGREAMMENTMPLMDLMVERATTVAWDTNGDTVLSPEEIAAGEEGLTFQDFDGNGTIEGMERMMGYQPLLLQLGEAMVLLEQPDQMALQAEIQAEIAAMQAEVQLEQDDFDLDNDGTMSEIELKAFQEASMAAQRELQPKMMAVVQESASRYMIAQWEIAVNRLDAGGDGKLGDEEWEAGYTDLRVERDSRMFRYLYDADRDSTVSDPEVARFMDAYDRQSTYADANLDGRVDPSDLRHFLDQVTRQ